MLGENHRLVKALPQMYSNEKQFIKVSEKNALIWSIDRWGMTSVLTAFWQHRVGSTENKMI